MNLMPRNSLAKKVSIILTILVSLAILMGVVFKLDNRWAKAKDVQRLALRLDQKINLDRANALQERMWMLEEKFGSVNNMPKEIKKEYRLLKQEWKLIMDSLNPKKGK